MITISSSQKSWIHYDASTTVSLKVYECIISRVLHSRSNVSPLKMTQNNVSYIFWQLLGIGFIQATFLGHCLLLGKSTQILE